MIEFEEDAMDEPTLQLGSQGDSVIDLQKLLEQAGLTPDPEDGDFGPATLDAVQSFQSAHGLDPDGVVGPSTWAALTGGASPQPDPAPDPNVPNDVPAEVVAMGFPGTFAQWTDDEKAAFTGGEPTITLDGDSPEAFTVLAMADSATDTGVA
jgi:peptidoglycan hydrolase-like protein with peptidoglycan-binding domain